MYYRQKGKYKDIYIKNLLKNSLLSTRSVFCIISFKQINISFRSLDVLTNEPE